MSNTSSGLEIIYLLYILFYFQINCAHLTMNHNSTMVCHLPDKTVLFMFHPILDVSSCKFADNHPTLDVLRHFPVKNSLIDVAKKIATDYKLFGTQLLKDSDGSKVRIIEMKHGDPVDITVEILEQWLQGRGRMPVTWQTLVKCLRDTDLHVLANKIESSLSEHNGSRGLDKVPSKEL